jgi:hypothetical protein
MLSDIFHVYTLMLSNIPAQYQGIVSVLLGVFLVFSIVQIIRKQFIWIIVLIVLFPTSIPILKAVLAGVLSFTKTLLGIAS